MQVFSEAAEGIRTLDLLHGKQKMRFPDSPEYPCKSRLLGRTPAPSNPRHSPRNHGDLWTECGPGRCGTRSERGAAARFADRLGGSCDTAIETPLRLALRAHLRADRHAPHQPPRTTPLSTPLSGPCCDHRENPGPVTATHHRAGLAGPPAPAPSGKAPTCGRRGGMACGTSASAAPWHHRRPRVVRSVPVASARSRAARLVC
jgi:hypothetical protein